MKTQFRIISASIVLLFAGVVNIGLAKNPHTGYLPTYYERPTLNDTCDPRPNILPDQLYNHHTPYRRIYNRPRDVFGYIAHVIEPTSQEAMTWWENKCAGRYDTKNAPPMCKKYWYPKPWEALNVEPRPDFARPTSQAKESAQTDVATVRQSPDLNVQVPEPVAK